MKTNLIIALFTASGIVSFISCKKQVDGCTDAAADNFNLNATDDDGSCLYSKHLGDSYGGGTVFYVDGQHGLIAAPSDQSENIQWYNGTYFATLVTATLPFSGDDNTSQIVTLQGDGNYAAKICADLELNGYDDWYLPAKSEMAELYEQRVVVGGFADDFYWTSTENNIETSNRRDSLAWYVNFTDSLSGYSNCNYKNYEARVRAIRAF